MAFLDWVLAFLKRARDLAGALDREGVIARALNLTRDRDLNDDRASALANYHNLVRALASYPPVPGRDRDLANDFARYRDLAQDLARYLDRQVDGEYYRPLPGRVRLAVWLLPPSWQPRYTEEFRAELDQLPRAERNQYAWRVLAEAWHLRKELAGRQCPPDGARAEG